MHSPFKLRMKALLNRSFIGKINLRSHLFWNHFFRINTQNIFQHLYHKYSYYTIGGSLLAVELNKN